MNHLHMDSTFTFQIGVRLERFRWVKNEQNLKGKWNRLGCFPQSTRCETMPVTASIYPNPSSHTCCSKLDRDNIVNERIRLAMWFASARNWKYCFTRRPPPSRWTCITTTTLLSQPVRFYHNQGISGYLQEAFLSQPVDFYHNQCASITTRELENRPDHIKFH